MTRDERLRNELTELGWRVLVVWECEICKVGALEDKFIDAFHKSQMLASPLMRPTLKERGRDN